MLTIIELKEKSIAEINNTDDAELLNQLNRIIELESEIDDVYFLSPEEMKAVEQGIGQLNKCQYSSNDEANELADQCLKK
jgi:hypothetical protein